MKKNISIQLQHRGPDAVRDYEDQQTFMLQTRLKIIDLGDSANQPFLSPDKRYVMVYNGECYNYRELKKRLSDRGHEFLTTSDTEVLMVAFLEWGTDFIKHIYGMFSLIIYDTQSKKSYVWRDRLGIKPLYFTRTLEGLIFSSEIKPLLPYQTANLNHDALWSYFNLRYVAGSETMFMNIQEVPPGAFWICDQSGEIAAKTYWDLRDIKPQVFSPDATGRLKFELEEVVRSHLVADVNIGCFLSGGVDSASLAALSRKSGHAPDCYTLSTGLDNDESDKAALISGTLELTHSLINVVNESFDLYKQAIYHLEDPIGDSIIVPTYLLAKGAASHSKVVLSGEGADEIFSGYIHHQFLVLENNILKKIPRRLWPVIGKVISRIPLSLMESVFPYPSKLGREGFNKLVKHFTDLNSPFERYMDLVSLFDDDANSIFSEKLHRPKHLAGYWDSMGDMSYSDKLKRFDLFYWGRNYTLHRLDRLSMAHSLEARVPFFDHRLVELMLKIPSDDIFHPLDPKKFFRKSLSESGLPTEVIKRKKQAFYLPAEKVFNDRTLLAAKEQILDNAGRRGIFNKQNLEKLLHRKQSEMLDAKKFQVIYHFELWAQIFLDKKIK